MFRLIQEVQGFFILAIPLRVGGVGDFCLERQVCGLHAVFFGGLLLFGGFGVFLLLL